MISLLEIFPLSLSDGQVDKIQKREEEEEEEDFREKLEEYIRNLLMGCKCIHSFTISKLNIGPSMPSILTNGDVVVGGGDETSIKIEWKKSTFSLIIDILLLLNPSASNNRKAPLSARIHKKSLAKSQGQLPVKISISSPTINLILTPSLTDINSLSIKKQVIDFDFIFQIEPLSFLSNFLKNYIIKPCLLKLLIPSSLRF